MRVWAAAGAFHRQVVAEGVESQEHGALLLQLGCEQVQGFGIARPMPTQQLPSWAAAWQASPVWSDGTQMDGVAPRVVLAAITHD